MTFCWAGFILSIVKKKMVLRTYTIEKKNPQHNQIWEWEETPELLAAIEQLSKSTQVVKSLAGVVK